jgi:hypothetical protein
MVFTAGQIWGYALIIPASWIIGIWSQILHQSRSSSSTLMMMASCKLQLVPSMICTFVQMPVQKMCTFLPRM